MRRLTLVVVLFAAAVTAGVASCKQGEGERCQVKSDCDSGLVCNQATGTCQTTGSNVDGEISPDARLDAGPEDAAVDADTTDAAVDAEE
jgi:hypothetical protein